MYHRKIIAPLVVCLLFVAVFYLFTASAGATKKSPIDPTAGRAGARGPSVPAEPRDEKLWQKALAIHRKAIVVDTHNEIGRASCRERV